MRAIIFDMDGVISDTQTLCSEAESRTLSEFSILMTPSEITRRFAGVRSQEWLAQVLKENGRPAHELTIMSERRWQLLQRLAHGNIREIPGSVALIRSLAGRKIPLAVASASRRIFVETVLSSLGVIECFQVIVSSDDVSRGKPDPMPLLVAADRLGVAPKDCLVIEDAENGMMAAKAAGMRCIGLVPKNYTRPYSADQLVNSLSEINGLLDFC